ncbi:MAG TPA: ATP-binding protein [Actinomycetota bacterium]
MKPRRKRSARQEGRLLLELSRKVSTSLDVQEVLDLSLAALHQIINFDGGSIQFVEDGALRLVAAEPGATPEAYAFRLPLGEGFGGRVAVTGEPIYSPDATTDARAHPVGRAKASTAGVRSYFAAPLIEHGHPIGIVQFDSHVVDAFSAETQAQVIAFLPTITAAVQNARLFERELQTIERLRETQRLKNDFLAVGSHELRTPLTAIIGFAQTIADHSTDLDPELVTDMAQRIVQSSRSLQRIVEDLQLLSRLEEGARPALRPVPVDALVAGELAGMEERDVRVSVARGPLLALADEERLARVLVELLSNASKHSPAGTPLEVSARKHGDAVEISVRNQGDPIPPERFAHIFDRFTQLQPADTRSGGGLGIGLYLARRLCESMNGSIAVASDEVAGTTFTVSLRAARSP